MITLQEKIHGVLPPGNWDCGKFHGVLHLRKGLKNVGMQEDNLLSLSYGRIVRKDIDGAEGLLPESFETYQIVEQGNIVLRLTDLQNDKRSLRQGLVHERGIITSAYDAVEVGSGHDPRFWAYTLLALDLAKYYYSLGGGVRQSLKFKDFPNEWIAAPGPATQIAIAEFLDRETARIDGQIERKRKFLDLLDEKEFALVSQLLTSGLFPDVLTKLTDVPWLDKIPAHWTWARMKDVCLKIIDCKNRTPPEVDDGKFFVVRTSCVRSGQFDIDGGYRTDQASFSEWTKRGVPQTNDVLFTREAPMGEACITPEGLHFCLGQRMMIYRADPRKIEARYIVRTVYSAIGKSYIEAKGKGSTVGHLRVPEVYDFPCLLPPIDEQRAILDELDRQVGDYDALRWKTRKSIEILRELRFALIAAAVTGQIDVTSRSKQGSARLDVFEEGLA